MSALWRTLQVADEVLTIRNGRFAWRTDGDGFELRDINLKVKRGQLIGVIGPVGGGKTTLLHAIVGELQRLGGSIHLDKAEEGAELVTQEPWIQRGTVRDNVLFGQPYQAGRYRDVLDACALDADLRLLDEGDLTQVGDNGVTLSGGQKARLALARAVYQDRSVYLLDDVLSAVDAQVAKHLVDRLVLDYLKTKTRLLVTHQPQALHSADWVLYVEGGRIVRQGLPSQILPALDATIDATDGGKPLDAGVDVRERPVAVLASPDEQLGDAGLDFDVYVAYLRAVGVWLTPAIGVALLAMQATRNVSDWWLAHWVSANATSNSTQNSNSTDQSDQVVFYVGVYGALAAANSVATLFRAFLFAHGGLRAARFFHQRLVDVILQAKISFFDGTPVGRIVNRFSSDTYAVDDSLPFVLNILLAQLFATVGTLAVACVGLPWMLLLLLPLASVYWHVQRRYRPTSRQLKRLAAATLSPVYSHFSETLAGLAVVRSARSAPPFRRRHHHLVEENLKTQFAAQAASQWFNLRLQLIGVGVATGVAALAVVQHQVHAVDPALVGLAIAYALSLTAVLGGVVTSFVDTEKELVSVERLHNYIQRIPIEEPLGNSNFERHRLVAPPAPADDWPQRGVVAFRNVSMKYRDHYPLALRNVSFETRPAEKLGVVGRTGSGKSSLFQVLFRLVETHSGGVSIDGVDVRHVPLDVLRSRIAIIPQTPFLLSGSVRDNLDPTRRYGDGQLWRALSRCHLAAAVTGWGGLDADVLERGSLLSAGQKQLLCLARALLLNAQVICIDEATANVDAETDRLIQQTMRVAFHRCTVLTIAHRTATTLDCQRILVLHQGQVVECDTPAKLLEQPGSHFAKLVACFQ